MDTEPRSSSAGVCAKAELLPQQCRLAVKLMGEVFCFSTGENLWENVQNAQPQSAGKNLGYLPTNLRRAIQSGVSETEKLWKEEE